MAATLTITFGDEILKALRARKSITLALGSANGRSAPAAPARRAKAAGARRAGKRKAGANGQFRKGSLPARLVAWASGRKRPFGVPEVMRKLRIKRAHASMVLTSVAKAGVVRRVGRGAYRTA